MPALTLAEIRALPAHAQAKIQSQLKDVERKQHKQAKELLGGMNKTEARYSEHLRAMQYSGKIKSYSFERIVLKLAPNTHYRPDFLVEFPDGRLELHEVKGPKGATFYCREDAWLKIKLVAAHFPFPVFVVWPSRNGWNKRSVGE